MKNDMYLRYETVLCALKFGFYYKSNNRIKFAKQHRRTLQYSPDFKTMTIQSEYDIETPVALYGKTWALTLEELE